MSANELYYGQKLNISHLRVFGSIAYMHVSDEKRRNLDAKSEKCILVGYSHEQRGKNARTPKQNKYE